MTRKDIRKFVNKYLDESGKGYEVLTEYRHYNQELIEKDKEEIYAFFKEIYKFKSTMNFKDFENSKDGNKIYDLKHIYDLDEYENLIGLLFASGILIDGLDQRMYIFSELGPNSKYLIRELHDLDCFAYEEDYMIYLDKFVLPVHRFAVNKDLLEEKIVITEEQFNFTNDELKDILMFWFNKSPLAASVSDKFANLLEEHFQEFINFAVIMNMMNTDGPTSLAFNILMQNEDNVFDITKETMSSYSSEEMANFQKEKSKFLETIYKEMQEKNRHL